MTVETKVRRLTRTRTLHVGSRVIGRLAKTDRGQTRSVVAIGSRRTGRHQQSPGPGRVAVCIYDALAVAGCCGGSHLEAVEGLLARHHQEPLGSTPPCEFVVPSFEGEIAEPMGGESTRTFPICPYVLWIVRERGGRLTTTLMLSRR
jgi:hypothetical protein